MCASRSHPLKHSKNAKKGAEEQCSDASATDGAKRSAILCPAYKLIYLQHTRHCNIFHDEGSESCDAVCELYIYLSSKLATQVGRYAACPAALHSSCVDESCAPATGTWVPCVSTVPSAPRPSTAMRVKSPPAAE
jgi:hypothetical protein